MPDRNVSLTAFGAAYIRAAHQLLDARPLVFEDPVALPLLGPNAKRNINDKIDMHQSPEWRRLRARVVLRSRYAEDRLALAIDRGVTQYVILGAGFDTFTLRRPEWARSLRVIEVDHKGTQIIKRRMIDAAGLSMIGNARFATVDFERESLHDGLARQEVSLNEPTFFSWLGVIMYLREEAIDATLRSVTMFAAGSEIVLTYVSRSMENGQTRLGVNMANLGEPWVSYFEPEEMERKLQDAGFSEVGSLMSETAEEKYFRDRPQDLPVPPKTRIVHAIV